MIAVGIRKPLTLRDVSGADFLIFDQGANEWLDNGYPRRSGDQATGGTGGGSSPYPVRDRDRGFSIRPTSRSTTRSSTTFRFR